MDVQLDAERRRRLEELAEERGMAISDAVCRLIDDAYEDVMLERRREAVRQLVKLEVEDLPDGSYALTRAGGLPMSRRAPFDSEVVR